MDSAVHPSTPITQPPSTPSTSQTGTWVHPRFDEIARRQNAKAFTERNIKRIIYNCGGLLVMWLIRILTHDNVPSLYRIIEPLRPYSYYIYILIRTILMFNILVACLPLVRRRDDLSDIPLTPAQRKLLGIPPTNTPSTSGSDYITPPRYRRSSTPHSVSPSSAYSQSPLSGKGNPAPGPQASPYSPSNPSPLRQKAFRSGIADARRSSYGTQSPLGPGTPKGSVWVDGSSAPSPSMGKGSSVPLNSKWLYEKRRGSGGDANLFS